LIENESQVELQAIGIGHDVTKYYKNAITIHRAEELGEVLLDELTKLFKI
jgi:cobaltochelatase CobT